MVLTGHKMSANDNICSQINDNAYAMSDIPNGLNRSRAHNMVFMMGACQNPCAKNGTNEIGSQSILMANQVSNVNKRVHETVEAMEYNDNIAKRCCYESVEHFDDSNKHAGATGIAVNSYQSIEGSGKRCRLDDGDIEMDVDLNLGHHLFSQQSCDEEPQLKQQQQQQQELQQQQQQKQEYSSKLQSQLMAQIFQDQNNDFCTMGHDNFGLNSLIDRKFTKTAEFPDTIDDVEYMYQTTHGGDFMRHLNSYSGEDL